MDVLTQKKIDTFLRFEFEENQLSLTHRDRSGEMSRKISYEKIDFDNSVEVTAVSRLVSRNKMLLGLAVFSFFMVILFSIFPTLEKSDLTGILGIFLLLGLISPLIPVKKHFTFVPAGDYKIKVLQGKHHDEILEKMRQHWKERARKICLPINFANNPANEIERYRWLLGKDIISETEFTDISGQIDRHTVKKDLTAFTPANPSIN